MQSFTYYKRAQSGFSLVEIMIGLVIGMIAVIVMMQVFSVSEGYKRTTTGGDDAQNNGAIALYGLQRDLRQSGHAMNSLQLVGCNLTVAAGRTINAFGPVTINHASIPAGDANSDTLLVIYSNTNGAPEGELVQVQPATQTYTVATPTTAGAVTYAANDRVIALPQPRPSPCNVTLDTVTGTTAPSNVTVTTGRTGMANGILYNVGTTPRVVAYAVRGGNLTACDYLASDCAATGSSLTNPAIWVPIASNIVALRAQYGQDGSAPMDATVDFFDQTTPTTACMWARVSAVRIALVARSALLEKVVVTTGNPTWAGTTANPAGSTALPIDLSGIANSGNYRYKVFETLVPQRNMAWMGVQAGC